jgi:hypothetical protein
VRAPDGVITTFDVPGSNRTSPTGINPAGEITGSYGDASGTHGFLRGRHGTITKFDPLGSISTAPIGINPAGVITGQWCTQSSVRHGFVRIPHP